VDKAMLCVVGLLLSIFLFGAGFLSGKHVAEREWEHTVDMCLAGWTECIDIAQGWKDTAYCERKSCEQVLNQSGNVWYSSFCGREEITPTLQVQWVYWEEVD